MKKVQKIIVCILLVFFLGTSFSFAQERTIPVDVRAQGMGHAILTDAESMYTLFENPAGLAFTGKKVLWPTLVSMNVGGPLGEMFDVSKALIEGLGEGAEISPDLVDLLLPLIGDTGLNFNTKLSPLTFGRINKNFGWGVLNTISLEGNIPSLTKSDIQVGLGADLFFGYGFPLNLGIFGTISTGFSLRGIAGGSVVITEGLTDILNGGLDTSNLPLMVHVGLGIDLGIQYDLFNFVSLAVVVKDCYSPVWSKDFSDTTASFKYGTLEPQVAVGVGVDVPLEKITFGIISHLGVTLEYENFLQYTKSVYRNPLLELSGGVEVELFDFLAVRAGIHEMYPAAGVGLYLGGFRIDYSIYGKELGLEPGYNPQLNMGLSMSIQY